MAKIPKTIITLAPNAFKECLTASQVAQCMKRGVLNAFNNNLQTDPNSVDIHCVPLADGGDGSADVLIEQNNGQSLTSLVNNPIHKPIDAKYGIFSSDSNTNDKGDIAVVEIAQSSGVWLLTEQEKNSLYTDTYGTGQLILNILKSHKNIRKMILCIGGSATNDGGFGMANAFGIKFYDSNNNLFVCNTGDNSRPNPFTFLQRNIKSMDIDSLETFQNEYNINNIEFIIASDVTNPLLGSNGATAIFGNQKLGDEALKLELESELGSESEDVNNIEKLTEKRKETLDKLESYMHDLCDVYQWDNEMKEMPGSGASGGLGASLKYFLNAKMESGFDIIAKYCNLENAISQSNLVITGEGAIDHSTQYGKVPTGVQMISKKYGINTVFAICGKEDMSRIEGIKNDNNNNGDSLANLVAFPICNGPMTLDASMNAQNASKLIEHAVYKICKTYQYGRGDREYKIN